MINRDQAASYSLPASENAALSTFLQTLTGHESSSRRAILDRLLDGPVSVGELEDDSPISRSAISRHLRIFSDRAEGTCRLYEIN